MLRSESTRLAYLDAMGVEVWVPRIELCGAKPAPLRRAAVAPAAALVASDHAGAAAPAADSAARSTAGPSKAADVLRELQQSVAEKPAPTPVASSNAGKTETTDIALDVYIAVGVGVLVSDRATGAADSARLACNILRALPGAVANHPPRHSSIEWPPAARRESGHDLAAAREFVGASIAAALQQADSPRLLVLGEEAASMLTQNDAADRMLEGVAMVRGPSLQTMLAEPQTKASLWRAMQSLID